MEYSIFLAWFLPRVLAVGVAEDDVADRDKTFWDLPFFTERKAVFGSENLVCMSNVASSQSQKVGGQQHIFRDNGGIFTGIADVP